MYENKERHYHENNIEGNYSEPASCVSGKIMAYYIL